MSASDEGASSASSEVEFRCRAAARWMPRTLSAAFLVGAMLAAFRLDAAKYLTFGPSVQGGVVVVGGIVALWILRAGAEARLRVRFDGGLLHFSAGSRNAALKLDAVDRLDREAPFGPSRRLFPAVVILDRDGRPWRVPVVIRPGEPLVREIVARTGRSDLEAWAESLRLEAWMRGGQWFVVAGYALAAAIVGIGWLFYAR
jgi:hypothetical protein